MPDVERQGVGAGHDGDHVEHRALGDADCAGARAEGGGIVDSQGAGVDRGAAGVGIRAGEGQPARAELGQAEDATDRTGGGDRVAADRHLTVAVQRHRTGAEVQGARADVGEIAVPVLRVVAENNGRAVVEIAARDGEDAGGRSAERGRVLQLERSVVEGHAPRERVNAGERPHALTVLDDRELAAARPVSDDSDDVISACVRAIQCESHSVPGRGRPRDSENAQDTGRG